MGTTAFGKVGLQEPDTTFQSSQSKKSASVASKSEVPLSPALAAALSSTPTHTILSQKDVTRLGKEGRVLLLLHGVVVDVTEFVSEHPGGARAIESRAGQEAGEMFDRIHSNSTKKRVTEYVIGRLAGTQIETPNVKTQTAETAPLHEAVVLNMENVTGNVKCITLSCPERLALLPGGHVEISIPNPNGKGEAKRNHYTPYQCTETSFTLAVKRYPDGVGSNYLHSLRPGESIQYAGPIAPLWSAQEDAGLKKAKGNAKHTILICGGTGVAPVYTIAQHLLENQITNVTVIGCFQDTSALLLQQEMAKLVKDYGDVFQLHYVFSRLTSAEPMGETKAIHFGRFGKDVVSQLQPAAAAVVCGPPGFVESVGKALIEGNVCADKQVHPL